MHEAIFALFFSHRLILRCVALNVFGCALRVRGHGRIFGGVERERGLNHLNIMFFYF